MELDDEPPTLVDVHKAEDVAPSALKTQMRDTALSKVPLTIITGIQVCQQSKQIR